MWSLSVCLSSLTDPSSSDYQRLTFFYFSPNYVVFNNLVHDLFRIFKKRIWMSSVNAATAGRAGGLANYSPPKDHAFASRPPRFGIPSHEGPDHADPHVADASKKAYDQVLASINSYNPSRFELTKPGASTQGGMPPSSTGFPNAYAQSFTTASALGNGDDSHHASSGAEYAFNSSQQLQNAQQAYDHVPRPYAFGTESYLSGAGYGLDASGGFPQGFSKDPAHRKQGLSNFY